MEEKKKKEKGSLVSSVALSYCSSNSKQQFAYKLSVSFNCTAFTTDVVNCYSFSS